MRTEYMTGRFLQWILVAGLLGGVGMSNKVRAQAVDLLGLGINANFETPDQADGAGETHSTLDLGPGWTFNLLAGASNDFGVQDPADGYFGAHPLPSPFDGRQIGYFNLDPYSVGEAVSAPVGAIVASQSYTLNVAVGARNNIGWSDQRYLIGLRTAGGTDLGTFASIDMDPGLSETNISDLQYTLSSAQAAAHVGEEIQIVIRGINLGTGTDAPAFTQPNFDNVRLSGTLAAIDSPLITINRATGAVTLSKTGTSNLNISGYSLTSTSGAFSATNWLSVANNYDKNSAPTPGNGLVDNDDAWQILGDSGTGGATELSEAEVNLTGPGNGGTLASGSPVNLGNVWLRTPYEDVAAQLSLTDGSVLDVQVAYTGTAIPSGDLTGDSNINGADWTAFKNGQGTEFTDLSSAEGYLKGDLNDDGEHDLQDFLLFRTAYDTANGAGSFAALIGVPEPSTAAMLFTAVAAAFCRRASRKLAAVVAVGCTFAFAAQSYAQFPDRIAHWSFDTATLTTNGSGNIIGAADATGNHDATVLSTGIGGGDGATYISAPFAGTDSVPGQFGQALRFNGDNFMLFPNLTELMEASGAPSYSVSMWVQWPTTSAAPTGGTSFATLGDWGLGAADSGMAGESSRFVYAFGPNASTSIRNQVRRNHPDNGNGDDIYADTEAIPGTINDGNWHMLSWTHDTTTGVAVTYFDGIFVDDNDGDDGPPATEGSFQMANSTSPFGALGLKGDNGVFLDADVRLDDVVVFDGVLDQEQITNLFQNSIGPQKTLTLRVDPLTGRMQLRNDSDGNETSDPIVLNSYRITSAGNSLDSSGWSPIASQSVAGFPVGNGSGNGWESGPGSDNSELTEWYLLGDSMLNKGDSIDLGFAYDESVDAQDLAVNYLDSNGAQRSAKVIYAPIGGSVPGDYNGDGTVNAADYTVWRDHLGETFQLLNEDPDNMDGQVTTDDYDFWKANFGNTTPGSAAVAGAPTVPEPSVGLLFILGCSVCACGMSRQSNRLVSVVARRSLLLVVAALAVAWGIGNSTQAAYTVDREYQFGDDSLENGADGIDVGSASTAGPNTLDTIGGSLAFIDLAPNGATGLPVYIDVSQTSPNLTQVRPGAPSGNVGILFDGVDDYLSGLPLNYPSNAPGTHNYTEAPGPLNYDGIYTRGFQLWVYPDSDGDGSSQHIVNDTRQHGVRINADGDWVMLYNNNQVDSNVAVNFDQWSHVMVAMPATLPNRSVLYVDGVAIAARQSNYTNNAAERLYLLTIGADTGNTEVTVGDSDYFHGVLDELDMFVWGATYDVGTNTFTDLGQFDYATDNEYAASQLTGVAGDVNQDSALTQTDVDDFVAGWLSEKRVNNIRVGDMTTILNGDLNFDGITDLLDLSLLRGAISGAGSGSFDVSALDALGVPEPTALVMALLGVAALAGTSRRRGFGR